MASQTQQSLTLKYHISFEAIINNGNKGIICNLLKEQDEVLKVQDSYILKNLEGLTTEQDNKRLLME